MEITEEFNAFTYLFQYCRPKDIGFTVYEVDSGSSTDFNIIMKAAKFNGEDMISESSELIISKVWVLENIENVLRLVPDN